MHLLRKIVQDSDVVLDGRRVVFGGNREISKDFAFDYVLRSLVV
jgi:hypothetical protein